MKVICAGMPKTGTKSTHVALERLGYGPVHDYLEHLEYFVEDYARFAEKGWSVEEFRQMYENVDAVTDMPAYYFWEELAEAFQDAKVILMVRDDEDSWYRSIRNQIATLNGPHVWLYHIFGGKGWKNFMVQYKKSFLIAFGGIEYSWYDPYFRFPPEILAKQQYRKHNSHVINTCPKDRLLVFNCKEGWAPLCKFLGTPIPDKPFPRVNIGGELSALIWKTEYFSRERRRAWTNFVLTCFGLSVIICGVKKSFEKFTL